MFAWLGMGNEIYSLIAILVLFFFVFTDRSELDRFNGARSEEHTSELQSQ